LYTTPKAVRDLLLAGLNEASSQGEALMDRRSFLATTAVAAAATVAPRIARAATPKTYVLVHGAWHGGWCWSKVAAILRGRGHTVITPTQTGLGERSHLLSKSITLDTFVDDIVNVLKFEDLKDVILVGHSFGGNAVSGTADRVPERIKQLVYLDAAMLENGQSVFSMLPASIVEARKKAAQESSGGVSIPAPPGAAFGIADASLAKWLEARLTPHPLGTYDSPLNLKNKVTNGLPAVYISCTDPAYGPLEASKNWVKKNGMKMVEIKTGHDAMVTLPDRLGDMLDADSV
jgi:pimeloyl-ACP methyl ester carboxylesterase